MTINGGSTLVDKASVSGLFHRKNIYPIFLDTWLVKYLRIFSTFGFSIMILLDDLRLFAEFSYCILQIIFAFVHVWVLLPCKIISHLFSQANPIAGQT